MYYSSLKPEFKSIFGAVESSTPVTYNISAPECYEAYMLIRFGDFSEYNHYQMQRQEDGNFSITKSFDRCGVYFYKFKVYHKNNANGTFYYRAPDGSSCTISKADWQQTIYKNNFTQSSITNKSAGLIYQIFPDRFNKAEIKFERTFSERVLKKWNETPLFENHNIGSDYFGGNLAGVTEKLPYLKELSVTAIYLNPIFEAHSNHRYNTADYFNVDPMLGTNDDFKNLCKEAKSHGISVILDGVFSHTGSDSVYFNKNGRYQEIGAYQSQNSPYYSWFNFINWPDIYAGWWGHKTLPETNEHDPSFSEFITGENGVIDYWMNLGASGFRLDVADELPDDFIKKIKLSVKRNNGILYGEVWEDASNKISYGAQREFLLGDELDSVMNYPFANLIVGFIKGMDGVYFINSLTQLLENYPKPATDLLMNLLDTHDTARIITLLVGLPENGRGRSWQSKQKLSNSQLKKGFELLKLASVLQYTLPGIPCLYYGDEILDYGYGDPFSRSCFDWDMINVRKQSINWYQFLGLIRSYCPALDKGKFVAVQYEKNYISFLRVKNQDEIFIVVNPSDSIADIWLLPGWKDDQVILGNAPVNGILTVAPKSAAIMGRGDWCDKVIKLKEELT